MSVEKDEGALKKRFQELADKSYACNMFTFTDFLGLKEQDLFWRFTEGRAGTDYTVYDADGRCERKLVRFGDPAELGYEQPFPAVCIHIRPLQKKFADELTHRDFLGAVMNLGIERDRTGDIFVQEREGYLFALESIAPYIVEQLTQIKHTNVQCEICESLPELLKKEPERRECTVASERADLIVAKLYNLSRSEGQSLFAQKKVFINGRLTENNSRVLSAGDSVSVRGFGRFIYYGVRGESRKGKYYVSAGVYI